MSIMLAWLMILGLGGGVGLPLGVPPLAEDPLLAKVAPEECLGYFASAGVAKPQADSPNHTEQLFAEPEVQSLVAQAERLIRARLAQTKDLDATGKAAFTVSDLPLGDHTILAYFYATPNFVGGSFATVVQTVNRDGRRT